MVRHLSKKKWLKDLKKVDERFDKTDKRIDKLGIQLAELEEDAPTIEEFGDLKKES